MSGGRFAGKKRKFIVKKMPEKFLQQANSRAQTQGHLSF